MRRPLVAGNWKMNGTCAGVAELTSKLKALDIPGSVETLVFPTFLHAAVVVGSLKSDSIGVGVQDCASVEGYGALTGEISVDQIRDLGCTHVLIGHSERRIDLGESDAVVAAKLQAVVKSGLTPILCVGETLEQRESGETLGVIGRQVESALQGLECEQLAGLVLAYEPVWAIGTGLTASPEQAQEVHAYIRTRLGELLGQGMAEKTRILYGGSVKASNAAELFAMADIDGGLVGGASLKAEEFGAVCCAAEMK